MSEPSRSQLENMLRDSLRSLASLPVEDLQAMLPKELEAQRTTVTDIAALATECQRLPLGDLPGLYLGDTARAVQHLAVRIGDARQRLSALPGPGSSERTAITNDVRSVLTSGTHEAFQRLWTAYSYLAARKADLVGFDAKVAKLEADYKERVSSTKQHFELESQRLSAVRGEVEQLAAQLRRIAGDAGASSHQAEFAELATKNRRRFIWWTIGLVATTAFAGMLGFAFARQMPPIGRITDAAVVQELVFRGTLVAITVVVALTCIRMMRAHVHLQIENEHRAAALTTFKLFVASAADKDVRDKVLDMAAQTVFAPGLTGIVNPKEERSLNEFHEIATLLRGSR